MEGWSRFMRLDRASGVRAPGTPSMRMLWGLGVLVGRLSRKSDRFIFAHMERMAETVLAEEK